MRKLLAAAALMLVITPLVQTRLKPCPPDFRRQNIQTGGATLFMCVDDGGPTVVLLHGSGDTDGMWASFTAEPVYTHIVVMPDLRGIGLSSHFEDSYNKRTQAGDIRAVLIKLNIDQTNVVGHDIGAVMALAYTTRYPDKTARLVVMGAPVPGVPPWGQTVCSPKLWYLLFDGPDVERLVEGRERIYPDRFWSEFVGNPFKINGATHVHYVRFYAKSDAMHSAFAQFLSIP